MAPGLGRRFELPRDALAQALRGLVLREAEAVHEAGAARELLARDLAPACVGIGRRGGSRALEPGEIHGASILGGVQLTRVVARCLALAIALAPPGAIATARADGTGLVVAAAPGETRQVASAVAAALAGRAQRVVPDAIAEARANVAAGAVPVETLAAFRRVREQIHEGWKAYLRVAVDVAAIRLASARRDAEALVAYPGGAELYADAALRLGVVLDHLGRRAESQGAIALALSLDPDRPIELSEFSPDVVELVAATRRAPVAKQRLRVTSTPAGATVRVDGVEVGRAPLEVEVTRGQHVVAARLAHHVPHAIGVAVDEPAAVALALEVDPERIALAGGAALGMPERDAQRLVEATLRYADLDEVVIVAATTRRGGPTLFAQRCAGIPARCSAVVEIGYGERAGLAAAARGAWEAVRAGELRYPPAVFGERASAGGGEVGCKLCRSPWLWSGVGAAVVVGTVLAVVALSSDRPPPTVVVDPGVFVPRQ